MCQEGLRLGKHVFILQGNVGLNGLIIYGSFSAVIFLVSNIKHFGLLCVIVKCYINKVCLFDSFTDLQGLR